MSNRLKQIARRVVGISAILALLAGVMVPFASTQAAQITSRKVTLGSSAASASTTYALSTAALPSATVVKSVELIACTTASGACTTPTGFSASSSTLSGTPTGLGTNAGFTVNAATAGNLRIVNAANAVAPSGVVAVTWASAVNPSTTNTTYFLRMNTYSDAAWTTGIDSGVIAVSTSSSISVTASVDETLSFCTGTTASSIYAQTSCAGAAGTTVALGTITPTTTGSGASEMGIATNAGSGYAITYNGATLTSGANTITANGATAAASTQGTSQFGINLVSNTVPTVGATGTGTGWALSAQYAIVNSYAFVAGATTSIITNSAPQAFATWKVSHVANVSSVTNPGSYSTSINYVATPTF